VSTTYYLVSWTDHQRRHRGRRPTTREYGTTSTLQAAIRLAERLLPPDSEYVITTLSRTVHHDQTPPAGHGTHRPVDLREDPRGSTVMPADLVGVIAP
jgi:hypothetical protein